MDRRGAVAIVLIEQGRMLLIKRAEQVPRPGVWSPPTGWVEPGETAASAAEREALEELGITVRALQACWHCHDDSGTLRIDWWQVRRTGGLLRPDPAEVAECRWLRPEEYPALSPTFRQHHPFFAQILPRLLDDS